MVSKGKESDFYSSYSLFEESNYNQENEEEIELSLSFNKIHSLSEELDEQENNLINQENYCTDNSNKVINLYSPKNNHKMIILKPKKVNHNYFWKKKKKK